MGLIVLGIVIVFVIIYFKPDLIDAKYHFTKGYDHFQEKNYNRAISEFTRAIRKYPYKMFYVDAYWLRSMAYEEKGDYDLAIKDKDRLIQNDSSTSHFYSERGDLYAKKGNYEKAVEDYEAALKINPNESGANNALEEARKKLVTGKE